MKKEIIVFGVSAALALAMAPAALAVGVETDVNLHINDAQIDVTVRLKSHTMLGQRACSRAQVLQVIQ